MDNCICGDGLRGEAWSGSGRALEERRMWPWTHCDWYAHALSFDHVLFQSSVSDLFCDSEIDLMKKWGSIYLFSLLARKLDFILQICCFVHVSA